jgi:hypothetical protein
MIQMISMIGLLQSPLAKRWHCTVRHCGRLCPLGMTRTRSEAESSVANPRVKRCLRTARHCLNYDSNDLYDSVLTSRHWMLWRL